MAPCQGNRHSSEADNEPPKRKKCQATNVLPLCRRERCIGVGIKIGVIITFARPGLPSPRLRDDSPGYIAGGGERLDTGFFLFCCERTVLKETLDLVGEYMDYRSEI